MTLTCKQIEVIRFLTQCEITPINIQIAIQTIFKEDTPEHIGECLHTLKILGFLKCFEPFYITKCYGYYIP